MDAMRIKIIITAVMVREFDYKFDKLSHEDLAELHDVAVREAFGSPDRATTTYAKGWFTCGTMKYRREDLESAVVRYCRVVRQKMEDRLKKPEQDAERLLRGILHYAPPEVLKVVHTALDFYYVNAFPVDDANTIVKALLELGDYMADAEED